MVFGVAPLFFLKDMSERMAGTPLAAAAGMMAAASLVQLVGEGLEKAPGSQAWGVAAGLGLGAVFYAGAARWVRTHEDFDLLHLRRSGGAQSLLIVAAMTVHSLPEGIAIGVAFGSREAIDPRRTGRDSPVPSAAPHPLSGGASRQPSGRLRI